MPIFTRYDIKQKVNGAIKNKQDVLVDFDRTVNFAVRDVLAEMDIQSTRRRTYLDPGIFPEVYAYAAPDDLKGYKIISLRKLAGNQKVTPYSLVTYNEFMERRKIGTISIHEHDSIKKLLVSGDQDITPTLEVSALESITDDGSSWVVGTGAENIYVNTGNYVRGNGSLFFDISAAAETQAGIRNVGMNAYNVSEFDAEESSIFVLAYLSDADDVTGYTVRYGLNTTNYHQIVVNATHFNTAVTAGWNLLRFDVKNRTTVGAVDPTNCQYFEIYMNKADTKVSEAGFGFDSIVFANGVTQEIIYYSKYGWIDAITGAWKEESTSDSDFVIADSEEFNLMVQKATEFAGEEVEELQASSNAMGRYEKLKRMYEMDHPSDALLLTTDYQAQYYI